jgi:hypothetical protein
MTPLQKPPVVTKVSCFAVNLEVLIICMQCSLALTQAYPHLL